MSSDKVNCLYDFPVIDKTLKLELLIYTIVDKEVPNKFKPTLVRNMIDELRGARAELVKAMDLHVSFSERKHYHMSTAHAMLRNVEIDTNMLNNLQQIGDRSKAAIDMLLVDIFGQLESLLKTHARKMDKRQMQAAEA